MCFLGTQREEKTRGLVTLLFEVNLCGFYKGNEKLQASIALSRGKNDVTNDVAARGFYFFVRCCGFGSLYENSSCLKKTVFKRHPSYCDFPSPFTLMTNFEK